MPDPTGNRRFLTVEITRIDYGYTGLDINQVWAEAMHLYRSGFNYELSDDEVQIRDETNQEFEKEGVFDDKILTHYRF